MPLALILIVLGMMLLVAVVLLALQMPEIRRYMKIRSDVARVRPPERVKGVAGCTARG